MIEVAGNAEIDVAREGGIDGFRGQRRSAGELNIRVGPGEARALDTHGAAIHYD